MGQFDQLCKPLDALSEILAYLMKKKWGIIQTEMKEGPLLHGALTILS